MFKFFPSLAALTLALCLAGPMPGVAASPQNIQDSPPKLPEKTPEELARQSIEQMLRALEMFLHSVPQYEPPEITENGDIIIRRKHPKPGKRRESPEKPRKPGEPDATNT